MKVTNFYNDDLVNYASYSTIRYIGSAIDGQKNAARKILKTTLDKNITSEIKVSQFGSKISEYTEYLHGNIDGVIVTMAQNYSGTNNIPLLDREGNFGNRFAPQASASRYIYTNGSKDLFELFNKDDADILEKQFFEGHEIEPKFYLPSLPMLLINGSEGLATGFAQKILPRNPKLIRKFIEVQLQGGHPSKGIIDKTFTPYFEGFTGTVTQGETPKQWFIKGIATRKSMTKVEITELPVGYSLKDYIKILNKLEDDKVITNYKDKSDNGLFHFEVSFLSSVLKPLGDNQLLSKLKLIKTVSENYTAVNEHLKIQEFESAEDIFNYYLDVKLRYLQKRKDYLISKITQDIEFDASKYLFIKGITDETILVNKRKKAQIEADLTKVQGIIQRDDSYDYLLNMAIHSLTEERMAKLLGEIKNKKKLLDATNKISINNMWLEEL